MSLALHMTRSAYTRANSQMLAPQRVGLGICFRRDTPAPVRRGQPRSRTRGMDPERIRAAIAGNAGAISELLNATTPIVQARVARALLRWPEMRGRDIHADVADLSQEVFVALFTADSKALKAWDPARGLSFANFVGLLAQRRVSSLLRVRRAHSWTDELDPESMYDGAAAAPLPESVAISREFLSHLLERLQAQLSARGMELFQRLFMAQESVDEVCAQMGLTANAVHQWRRRLGVAAQKVLLELKAEQAEELQASVRLNIPAAVGGIKPRRSP
jgi:RNA polymerase sigma factor (sigma-70 family)